MERELYNEPYAQMMRELHRIIGSARFVERDDERGEREGAEEVPARVTLGAEEHPKGQKV